MPDIYGLIWITGLSGAGKTTLANSLQTRLRQELDCNPVLLDGDELRDALSADNDYRPKSRYKMATYYANLASLLTSQHHCVICSTVSMFHDIRDNNRKKHENYCEVFIDIEDDIRQHRKNIGSITRSDITNNKSDFQFPENPDFTLKDPSIDDMSITCDEIIAFIKHNWKHI